jgi:hypothetical protein
MVIEDFVKIIMRPNMVSKLFEGEILSKEVVSWLPWCKYF